jgi:AbrB family looped-hinge helix DNA binding protein
MRTTIDKAGRVVVPAALRAQLGLVAGPVEIIADGNGIRIEPAIADQLETEQGYLVLGEGQATDAEAIRELRLADQR